MSYCGLCGFLEFLLAPCSLLASFCVLAGTGNSTTTLCYCILEQNNCFSSGVKWRCGKFSSFLWSSDNLGEVGKVESCFKQLIQYRVTRRHMILKQTNKQTNRDFETLSLAKNRDSETPSYKKRDCETNITAKNTSCETREIRLKFCETQSFRRTIRHP